MLYQQLTLGLMSLAERLTTEALEAAESGDLPMARDRFFRAAQIDPLTASAIVSHFHERLAAQRLRTRTTSWN